MDHFPSRDGRPDCDAPLVAKGAEIGGRLRNKGCPVGWCGMGGGATATIGGIGAVSIAGNAGILVSRVLYTKQSGEKRFLIQDAAMNDLVRPAPYESFHRNWPVSVPAGLPAPPVDSEAAIAGTEPRDGVGPVCESGDFPAKDRALPRLDRGDLLATLSAGAHGMVLASNDNSRPRAAEILVAGTDARRVRRLETHEDLLLHERP